MRTLRNAGSVWVRFLSFCLLAAAFDASAASRASDIDAVLLPASTPGQARLALDWQGDAGERVTVRLHRAGARDEVLVADHALAHGVTLLDVPLASADGSLEIDLVDTNGHVAGATRKDVAQLRDVAGFAWQSRFTGPGLDNNVLASTVFDDGNGPALYVGGLFLSAGSHIVNHVARWDGAGWSALAGPSAVGTDAQVLSLAVYDGALIAGGVFTHAGGVAASHIARWDGHAWSALGAGMSGSIGDVLALLEYQGTLVAAGDFAVAGDVAANGVARWDGTAWSAFGIGIDSGTAFALGEYGGDLVVAGNFLEIGGLAANRIARWDGSAWAPLGAGVDGNGINTTIYALSTFGDSLVAGGFFSLAGGASASNVASWNGSAWAPLGTGANATVYALGGFGTSLIAGGAFTSAGGQSVNRVAAWDGTSWSKLTGPTSTGVNNDVRTLDTYAGQLYAGGVFATAGGVSSNRIARWNGTAWSALSTPTDAGLNGQVLRSLVFDGALYVGGAFTQAGTTTVNGIARWDGNAWSSLTGPSGTGITGGFNVVNAMAEHDGALYVGGSFTTAGGIPAANIARWDGSAWSAVTGTNGGGLSDRVWSLVEFDGDLIAGGAFTQADGTPVNRIARYDGSAWSPLTGASGTGTDNTVYVLGLFGAELIVGGQFANAGGVAANNIARWNGTDWLPLTGTSGTGVDSRVQALAVYDGALIAGGSFTHAGGIAASYIARWDGSDWSTLGAGAGLGSGCCAPFVRALALYDGALIVGGSFEQADGGTVNRIARWDGAAWSTLSGPNGVGTSGTASGSGGGSVETIVTYDADGAGPGAGQLAVGGNFSATGGVPNWGVGLYGPIDFTITPNAIDFGSVLIGTTSLAQSVTLANSGATDIHVAAIGGVASPFALAGGTCGTAPFTVAAGANCTLAFTYAPTSTAGDLATIAVSSDASTSPDAITLSGTGAAPPTIDLEPSSLAETLHPGEAGAQTLNIGNIGAGSLDWSVVEDVASDLTQSTSMTVADGNSFGCEPISFGQPPFPTSANSYYRVFHLADYGIDASFDVNAVTFGIEKLTTAMDVTIKLYTLEGDLNVADLTLIGSATHNLTAQTLQLVTVPVSASVPAGATLVVEIAAPSFVGTHDVFLPGSNALGETGATYIDSFGQCGIADITDVATLGFANMDLVMSVSGSENECALPAWASVDPASGSVAAGDSEPATITFDAGSLAPGNYSADLCVASNDPMLPLAHVPLSLAVVDTYVVTPGAGAHGTIAPDTPQTVDGGTTAAFTLAPDAGYHVDAVGGTCGGTLDGDVFTTDPVVADCSVDATFAIDAPTTIVATAGTPQTAAANTPFADALVVHVANDAGIGVPGVVVGFAVPAAGASAVVAASATTDDDGDAIVSAIAGTTAGSYTVVATTDGVAGEADFSLTNLPGALHLLRVTGGDQQSASVGTTFAAPLVVQAVDAWNNPVAGAAIAFVAPTGGASAVLSAGSTGTDPNGIAAVTATANAVVGSYVVTASAVGAADATFALQNTAPSVDLAIAIDDSTGYARNGQTLDYLVTVRNDGADVARGVDVTTVLPAALDAGFAHWICLDAGSGACTAAGDGTLADADATVPAHGRITYLLSVPVRPDATDDAVATEAMASSSDDPAGANATDTDVLVLFRGGFDDYAGDGAEPWATTTSAYRVGDSPVTYVLAPAHGEMLVDAMLGAQAGDGSGFRVERLDATPARVRVVAIGRDARERAAAWQPLGTAAAISVAVVDADGARHLDVAWRSGAATIALDAGPVSYAVRQRATGSSGE